MGGIAARLALLYALTILPRLLLMALMPIVLLALLGDAQRVSLAYLAASLAGIAAGIALPFLLRRVGRRRAYLLAGGTAAAAATGLAFGGAAGIVLLSLAGFILLFASVSAGETVVSLHAMEALDRDGKARFEPLRVTFAMPAFVLAPAIGATAADRVDPAVTFLLCGIAVAVAIAWRLRLRLADGGSAAAALAATSPLRWVGRFLRQPRLRLAYLLAAGRTSWWTMFFTYAPLILVERGYPTLVASGVSAAALAFLATATLWGRAARRWGVRALEIFGFGAGGILTLSLLLAPAEGSGLVVLLLLAACAVTALDGAGNVFFMRAVHPYERVEMTVVFSTYRDVSQALPPALFAPLLLVLDLVSLFALSGLLLIGLALLARHLPRGM